MGATAGGTVTADPAHSSRRPSPAARPSWWVPISVLVVCGGAWLIDPLVGSVAAALVTVVLFPVGATVGERLAFAALSVSAFVGVVFVLLPVGASRTASVALTLGVPTLVAAIAARRGPRALVRRLRVTAQDVGVVVTGVVAFAWVALPTLGGTVAQTMNRLYYGWDFALHFTMTSTVYRTGGLWGQQFDGERVFLAGNPQLHPTLWALGIRSAQDGSSDLDGVALLNAYLVAVALTFAVCAALLSWVAADLVRALAPHSPVSVLGTGAALLAGVLTLLGPAAGSYFFGHTPFVLAVTALLVGSYLAGQRARGDGARGWVLSLAVLACSGLVVLLEWPPLLLGLVPVGIVVVVRIARRSRRTTVAVVAVVAAVALSTPVWLPRATGAVTLDVLAAAKGVPAAFSPSLAVVGVGATVLAAVLLLVERRRPVGLALGVLGPVAGMLVFCLLLVRQGATWGFNPSYYYVLKALLGCLVVSTPVAVAVVVAGGWHAGAMLLRRSSRTPVALMTAGAAALVMAAVVVALRTSPPGTLTSGVPVVLDPSSAAASTSAVVARALPAVRSGAVPVLAENYGVRSNLWLHAATGVVTEQQHDFYNALVAAEPDAAERHVRPSAPPESWRPVVCSQLAASAQGLDLLTDHPAQVRAWVRALPASCSTDRIRVVPLPAST